MDTLELIRTFREVASRGSFSMAARTLDVSKANVSKYIAELETRLGTRLLNRTTRTVSLTDAGSLLLAGCPRAINPRAAAPLRTR